MLVPMHLDCCKVNNMRKMLCRQYMEYRNGKVKEAVDLSVWQSTERSVLEQEDGASCGLYVMMASEFTLMSPLQRNLL